MELTRQRQERARSSSLCRHNQSGAGTLRCSPFATDLSGDGNNVDERRDDALLGAARQVPWGVGGLGCPARQSAWSAVEQHHPTGPVLEAGREPSLEVVSRGRTPQGSSRRCGCHKSGASRPPTQQQPARWPSADWPRFNSTDLRRTGSRAGPRAFARLLLQGRAPSRVALPTRDGACGY